MTQRPEPIQRRPSTVAARALAFDEAASPMLLLDPKGNIASVNAAAARLLGVEAEDLVGQPLHPVLHAQRPDGSPCLPASCPFTLPLTEGGTRVGSGETLTAGDGGEIRLAYTAQALRLSETVLGVVITLAPEPETPERAADRLFAAAAHELRGAISVILSSMTILDRHHADELAPGVRPHFAKIARSAQTLLGRLNDVLEASRLGAGAFHLHPETTTWPAVLEPILADVEAPCEAKDVHIDTGIPPETATFRADPARLGQVLANLLGNAVRHVPRGGRVEVSVREQAGQWHCEVRDNGTGIAPEQLESLFQPFRRLKGGSGAAQGWGLGLYVSRLLVEAHGGRIGLSARQGGGTVAWFSLPIAPE